MLPSCGLAPLPIAFAGLMAAATLLLASPARAMPCMVPADCPSGFCVDKVCCDTKCDQPCDACSAATKGSGADGTCGLAAAGKLCALPYCDAAAYNYIAAAACDAAGKCVPPAPQSCKHNDPCKYDLCSASGCQQMPSVDGTPCGMGVECKGGLCVPINPMSSSSSSSTSGAGGAGGAMGSSSSSSGGGGGGQPVENTGCGCRAAGDLPAGGAIAIPAALIALLRRRRSAGPAR